MAGNPFPSFLARASRACKIPFRSPFERLLPRAQAMETMPGLISSSRLKDLHR